MYEIERTLCYYLRFLGVIFIKDNVKGDKGTL